MWETSITPRAGDFAGQLDPGSDKGFFVLCRLLFPAQPIRLSQLLQLGRSLFSPFVEELVAASPHSCGMKIRIPVHAPKGTVPLVFQRLLSLLSHFFSESRALHQLIYTVVHLDQRTNSLLLLDHQYGSLG